MIFGTNPIFPQAIFGMNSRILEVVFGMNSRFPGVVFGMNPRFPGLTCPEPSQAPSHPPADPNRCQPGENPTSTSKAGMEQGRALGWIPGSQDSFWDESQNGRGGFGGESRNCRNPRIPEQFWDESQDLRLG